MKFSSYARRTAFAALAFASLLPGFRDAAQAATTTGYVEIVGPNNFWRYNDQGARTLDPAWKFPDFDDSSWPVGLPWFAVLEPGFPGYVKTPMRDIAVGGGPIISYLFRTTFVMPADPAQWQLVFSNVVDDGAVFYVNGVETHRLRMPPGPILPTTPATGESAEGIPELAIVPATHCVPGLNTLAVEVHTTLNAPLDVVFGLSLGRERVRPLEFVEVPVPGTFYDGKPLVISSKVCGSPPHRFQWYKDGAPIAGATSSNLTIVRPGERDAGRYRVVVSNVFSRVASRSVSWDIGPSAPEVIGHPPANRVVFNGDGLPVTFSADYIGSRPMKYQWYHDGRPIDPHANPTATQPVLVLRPPRTADAGGYHVEVSNPLGSSLSRTGRLEVRSSPVAPGALDVAFQGAVPPSFRVLTDPCNRLIVGGGTSVVNGVMLAPVNRLLPDGAPDPAFAGTNLLGRISQVFALYRLPDGRLLVGGDPVGGRGGIFRLLPDGRLDPTFDPGTGPDGRVWSIGVQSDGRIIIGGFFANVNGSPRANFARLLPNGALDDTFKMGTGFDFNVYAIVVLPDDRMMVGGAFSRFDGVARGSVLRLKSDGSFDSSFALSGVSMAGTVYDVQPTAGGYYVVGSFNATFGAKSSRYIVRLGPNGAVDPGFAAGNVLNSGNVWDLYEQPADRKVVVVGQFRWTNPQGALRYGVARLNPDGSLDTTFSPGLLPNVGANGIAGQANGRLVVMSPTSYDGVLRPNIIRLLGAMPPAVKVETTAVPGRLRLSWPALPTPERYVVVASELIDGGAWSPVPGTATLSGGRWRMETPMAGGRRYYRLLEVPVCP